MAILGYNKFNLAEWLETRGLAGWLDIATEDLQRPDKQRIADEIGAHYAEAVSTHMAAGEPEPSARVKALADLGDPRVAARNFQKSHLTERQANSMQWMERMAAKPLFCVRMVLWDLMPLVSFILLDSLARRNPDLQLLAMAVFMAFAGLRLIPRILYSKVLPRRCYLKRLALSNCLTGAVVIVCYALFLYTENHNIFESGCLCLWILFCSNLNSNSPFRIWKKLRKIGIERNELPPWQTFAS